jgi:limonene 1,2-monooxygenase
MTERMKFGVFHPPFHCPIGRNPQLLLRRDVEFIQHLDRLGYDEAWIGEHHSCGSELVSDPLVFIPYVANLTQNIKLCTGVISLPYHNPLWVADRIVLIDHLTRGRMKVGLGPGVLTTDAAMIGLDPVSQRDAFAEDVDVLMHLLNSDEPLTITTDRYTLNDARLHLKLYSDIEMAVPAIASPTGPRVAGKHGISMLSIGATLAKHSKEGIDALGHMWGIYEARCEEFGHVADRAGWRLVGPMHIAETKEAAEEQVRHGIDAWFDYLTEVQAATHFQLAGTSTDERIAYVQESGLGVIGTPDDAIAQIDDLVSQSKGGFGAYLFMTHEWATWANTKQSYELFAEYVMPRYQGSLESLARSDRWARERRGDLAAAQEKSVQKSIDDHAAEQAAKMQPVR